MKKIISLLVLFAAFTAAFGQGTDFIVFKKGGLFIARDIISGEEAIKDQNAAVLLHELLKSFQGVGGNIQLMSGEYPIDNQLNVPSHVTISGKGASTVILIKENAKIASAFYSDSTSKVSIKELTISADHPVGEHSGIIFDHVGDCLVENVSISGVGAYGIWYRDRTFLSEVRGCKISDSGKSGIFFQGLGSGGRAIFFLI